MSGGEQEMALSPAHWTPLCQLSLSPKRWMCAAPLHSGPAVGPGECGYALDTKCKVSGKPSAWLGHLVTHAGVSVSEHVEDPTQNRGFPLKPTPSCRKKHSNSL